MNCTEVEKLLWFYAEGTLPESSVPRVKEHLQQCSACSALHSELKNTLQLFEAEKQVTANPFLYTRVLQKLENQKPSSHYFSIPLIIRNLALSSLAIFAGILLGINLINHTTLTQNVTPVSDYSLLEDMDEFLIGDISEEGFDTYFDHVNQEPK